MSTNESLQQPQSISQATSSVICIDSEEPADVTIEYFDNPFIPKKQVIGIYGYQGSGKSSAVSTICSRNSAQYSTLWISSEEPADWIKLRHKHGGASPKTIAVVTNPEIFTVNKYLVAAIREAKNQLNNPLGFVVLDCIAAMIDWDRGESANDDTSVKELIANLNRVAQMEDVSILMIGHLNKGKDHKRLGDAVLGATAWTSSVRLAYMFFQVPNEEHGGFFRSIKNNLSLPIGVFYKTVPVYKMPPNIDGVHPTFCQIEYTSDRIYGEKDLGIAMRSRVEVTESEHASQQALETTVSSILRVLQDRQEKTRKAIDEELESNIEGREWLMLDEALKAKGVNVSRGKHGTYHYQL